jgi:hypothetical protein
VRRTTTWERWPVDRTAARMIRRHGSPTAAFAALRPAVAMIRQRTPWDDLQLARRADLRYGLWCEVLCELACTWGDL